MLQAYTCSAGGTPGTSALASRSRPAERSALAPEQWPNALQRTECGSHRDIARRIAGRLRRVVIWGFQRVANFDSEPVGVFGADRCDAMGCVTINGSGSETFCRAVRGRLV